MERGPGIGFEPAAHLDAVHARHLHVDEGAVDGLGRGQLQAGLGAWRSQQLNVRQIGRQQLLQDEEVVGPVVHGQKHRSGHDPSPSEDYPSARRFFS